MILKQNRANRQKCNNRNNRYPSNNLKRSTLNRKKILMAQAINFR